MALLCKLFRSCRVYGTVTEGSDWDVTVVVEEAVPLPVVQIGVDWLTPVNVAELV